MFAGYFVAVVLLWIEEDIRDVDVSGTGYVWIHVTGFGHISAQIVLPFDENFAGHNFQSDDGFCVCDEKGIRRNQINTEN